MSSLSGATTLPADVRLHATRVQATFVAAGAAGGVPAILRPVEPSAAAARVPGAAENAVAATASRNIAAAVRMAALHGLMRGPGQPGRATTALGGAEPGGAEVTGPAQQQRVAASGPQASVGEIMARVAIQAAGLPVLPQPATPARDAFAEAVIAMRSGLRLRADGALAGSA